ncbi:MAG: tRNA pseudouridine(13) synthase TruD [Gemmataceae bacterium]
MIPWTISAQGERMLPQLTDDLAGIGGRIKVQPEDFEVEEIPAYEPSGQGEFFYLWIEKRALGALYFQRELARRLGVAPSDIGTAGMKDRQAVTRQLVSVPARIGEQRLAAVDGDGIRLLRVSKHNNKLKTGHLRGNRFRILVRDGVAETAERLGPLLDHLRRVGLPNYYGEQRFGREGQNTAIGLALLRQESLPGTAKDRNYWRHPERRRLALSAVQSALFNTYLARRLTDGLLRRVLAGDVMSKWPFGGLFVVADVPREQERLDRRETVATGPMFGRKMFAAQAEAAQREAEVLAAAGLTLEHFHGFGKLLPGTRRHNLVYLDDLAATVEPEGIRLTFSLPAGSYATVLLAELMKTTIEEESVTTD